MDLRFVNHPGFHRAASAMVVLGAGLSMVAFPLASRLHVAAPLIGGGLAIALGAAWAYGLPRYRAGLGLLACVPVAVSSTWGALVAMAVLTSVAVALGAKSRKRAAATMVFGTAAVTLAAWAALRVQYAQETASWAPLVRTLVGGAAMGMIGVLATLPHHVGWQLDVVLAAARKVPAKLDREIRQLCDRSLGLWSKAAQGLKHDPENLELLRSGTLKVLEVAGRIEPSEDAGVEQELAGRIAELDRRIEAASDAETKAQYTEARAGLEDQRKYRDRLRAGRERQIARLHNHVAALEKFHLAAVSLAPGQSFSADEPLGKQLAELTSEVSASGDALADVEG